MDRLPDFLKDLYKGAFRAANEAYYNGRVEATAKTRKTHWRNWRLFVTPLGVDPELQGISFRDRSTLLGGFAALVRQGYFGRGKQIQAPSVSSAITAVGKAIALVHEINPTKCPHSNQFIPRLQEMFEGWRRDDPPTQKKLPIEVDIPEWLVRRGLEKGATELEKATGDNALIGYYYLLRVGEYTVKHTGATSTTQTKQFKMKDVAFFGTNSSGRLYKLPKNARPFEIMNATCATLKLDNQKNGWKGVCVNHEHNGDSIFCAVRALGRRYLHIREHTADDTTFLSAFFENKQRRDVTDQHISEGIKSAAAALQYPATRGIPIDRVDTHSLRIGGACALALAGYSDTQIQKMGRWRGATFKEYVREELHIYSEGMSKAMQKKYGFVNVASGAYTDITEQMVNTEYDRPAAAA